MKPTRKRRISVPALLAAVRLALRTSARNAARASNFSSKTILREMRATGAHPRRPGNFTLAELDAMAGLLRF